MTNVFAGGAVIAEQPTEVSSRVFWIHADPVTGSHQKVWKDGTTDDYWRIELEPLGQEISPIEPLEEAPEYQPQSVRNPEEPEWLCSKTMIGGLSFHERPIQCKKAALEQGQRLDTLFYREERGNMIKLTDSPLWRKPSFAPGATAETNPQSRLAERARSKALKSSNKEDNDVESEKNRKERTFQVNITTEFSWDTEYLWDREQLSAEFDRLSSLSNTPREQDDKLDRRKNRFTQHQCDSIRKLLEREAEFGTRKAAFMSAKAYGSKPLLALDNQSPGGIREAVQFGDGEKVDLAWWITLAGINPIAGRKGDGGQRMHPGHLEISQAGTIYVFAWTKTFWSAIKVVTGQEVKNFMDVSERTAAVLAGSGKQFADAFDQDFMDRECGVGSW